jgi:hypothetical protein
LWLKFNPLQFVKIREISWFTNSLLILTLKP